MDNTQDVSKIETENAANKTDKLNKTERLTSRQTILLTILAVIGFTVGTLAVLGPDRLFHEIEYEPAEILDSMFKSEINEKFVHLQPIDKFDSSRMVDENCIRDEIVYRDSLLSRLDDSSLTRMLVQDQLFLNKDSFSNEILIKYSHSKKIFRKEPGPLFKWDYYIRYSYKHCVPIGPYHLQRWVSPNVQLFKKNNEFFSEYPGFILWSLLVILQFAFFPAFIACTIMLINNFMKQNKNAFAKKEKIKLRTTKYIIGATVATILFVTLSYFVFFCPNLVTSGLFYNRMNGILGTISLLGGITGVLCFTGFLLISGAPIIDKDGNKNYVSAQEVGVYNNMNTLFNNLLLISSVVLCIMVLTTGAFYSAINKLEFIQKIIDDFDNSPFAYHFVLLFASLLSVLLLIFFVPAKLRLVAMEKGIMEVSPYEDRIEKPTDLFDILRGLLVVGLPVITGIIHYFFDLFINH